MNIKKLLILAPVAVLSMTSCGKRNVRHEAEDYFLTASKSYDKDKGLKILQLSDLHLGTNCDRKVQYQFIQKTIDLANEYAGSKDNHDNKVDMIVITGDVFTFGTKEIAIDFCNFMEKQKINWTMTFGNHDEQCYFSVDWLTNYLNKLSEKADSYLLFKDLQDDDVFGNANFVISFPDVDSTKKEERLYIFDSNRYRYQIGSYGYDCIHNDQIDWYERCSRHSLDNEIVTQSPNQSHSLAFFHIPFEEFNDRYKDIAAHSGKVAFVKDEDETTLDTQREGVSSPKEHTNLYEKMIQLDTTEGVFVGHDHINNSAIQVYNNDGCKAGDEQIMLSFGLKGTDTVYADDDLIGGQMITVKGEREINNEGKITQDKKISIHTIKHTYKDLEVK